MSIVIFIIVLAVLIFVHELGHFLAAKSVGARVDEFSIGFPPRIAKWKPKKSETQYSLGIVPFGGYVKIFGEDPTEAASKSTDRDRALFNKSKWAQVWVLAAGVIFNVVFAWLFLSVGLMVGLPASETIVGRDALESPLLTVVAVEPGSPADEAGLMTGDRIVGVSAGSHGERGNIPTERFQELVQGSGESGVTLVYERDGVETRQTVVAQEGIVEGVRAIGVGVDTVGILQLSPHRALVVGAQQTVRVTQAVAVGLGGFIVNAVRGAADLSQISGPVGIVGLVGDAAQLGLVNLLAFTAFISINLALINLIPFPALDGGRILFVAIEAVKGSPIRPRVANWLNTAGFVLLIALLVLVTYNDIVKLVS